MPRAILPSKFVLQARLCDIHCVIAASTPLSTVLMNAHCQRARMRNQLVRLARRFASRLPRAALMQRWIVKTSAPLLYVMMESFPLMLVAIEDCDGPDQPLGVVFQQTVIALLVTTSIKVLNALP